MRSYDRVDCLAALGVAGSLANESTDLYACSLIDRFDFERLCSVLEEEIS